MPNTAASDYERERDYERGEDYALDYEDEARSSTSSWWSVSRSSDVYEPSSAIPIPIPARPLSPPTP